MTDPAPLPSREDFAAAIEWWRDSGVDYDFCDDVTDWLAPPPASANEADASLAPEALSAPPPIARSPLPVEIASPVRFGGEEPDWPTELAGFADWWLREPSLELGGTGPRIAPRGNAQPRLMVVIAHPEEQDQTELLSGAQGRLLSGILRAAGIAAEQTYVASVLPRFTAAPDWPQIASARAGAVLAHHIGLVQPERILFLGRNIPSLLGHAMAQEGKSLLRFNHKGRSIPYVEGQGLARLLRSAAVRRDFWQSWLDGTDG